MECPILIKWASPLSFLRGSGIIFLIFMSYFDEIHVRKSFCGVTSGAILFAHVPKKGPGLYGLTWLITKVSMKSQEPVCKKKKLFK